MYGTVARLRLKDGKESEMMDLVRQYEEMGIPGFRGEYLYKLDGGSNEYLLAVMFDDRESYHANANDPAQHERFQQYRALLESDPEWNDGEVVYNHMQ